MAYADYSFYFNVYHGTEINSDDWNRYALIASLHIDRVTFGRLKHGAVITDDVRMAVCSVAETLQSQRLEAAYRQPGIKTENIDGYSATYDSTSTMQKRWASDIVNAISLFIPPSDPLRYAGV